MWRQNIQANDFPITWLSSVLLVVPDTLFCAFAELRELGSQQLSARGPTKLAVEILVSFQYRNPHALSDRQKREYHSRRPATDNTTVWLRVSPAVVWNRRLVVRHKDLRFAATN